MHSSDVTLISAKSKPNTYFIFRDDGVEVEITLGDHLIVSHRLYEHELDYIHKNITKKPTPTLIR